MWNWLLLILFVNLKLEPTTSDIIVSPSCGETVEVCEIHLVINYNFTMTKWKNNDIDILGNFEPVVWNDGELKPGQSCGSKPDLTQCEKEEIQLGDGTHKRVILFNGQLPGPPIVVYENQHVMVHVENRLLDQPTVVHWHGLRQMKTPWMDGAGSVSQCPIRPTGSFTYRFVADPVGTHWYHSHHTSQRTMGAHGPLIILPRGDTSSTSSKASGKSPKNKHLEEQNDHSMDENDAQDKPSDHSTDHIMVISDWYHQTSVEVLTRLRNEFYTYGHSEWWGADDCYIPTRNVDGVEIGMYPYYSALINGKGYTSDPIKPPSKTSIHEVFHVSLGERHRFRIINTGMFFFLRVSFDHHDLHVTSTEGDDLHEETFESIIIGPGERYDVFILANDPLKTGSYVVRVETTEYYYNTSRMAPHGVTAILHYEGSEIQRQIGERPKCTPEKKCRVLNCPFQSYREEDNIECVSIAELSSKKENLNKNEDILELFLKLQFTGADDFGAFKPTINGVLHRLHAVPPQIYPPEGTNKVCVFPHNCPNDACYCTHELHVPLGQVVQMVIFTHSPPFSVRSVVGTAHTFHLHGHHFEVTKIGWPNYSENGYIGTNTDDITCDDNDKDHLYTCHSPRWTNSSWSKMYHRDPHSHPGPFKDTVIVPAGGYVVIRFKADNPGYWLMHCHMEIHNEMGMAMVMRAGNISQMPSLPKNFPSCGSFDFSEEEFNKLLHSKDVLSSQKSVIQIASLPESVSGGLSILVVFLITVILIVLWITFYPTFKMRFLAKLPFSQRLRDETSLLFVSQSRQATTSSPAT